MDDLLKQYYEILTSITRSLGVTQELFNPTFQLFEEEFQKVRADSQVRLTEFACFFLVSSSGPFSLPSILRERRGPQVGSGPPK